MVRARVWRQKSNPTRRRAVYMFMRLSGLWLLLALFHLSAALAPAHAAVEYETAARNAILIDAETGTVLYEKEADKPIPPASMSKLMTVYMVFERLKDGRLSLDDTFPVSEKAWRKGGSKMFVDVNTDISVQDLIQGIIVQSGNDACIVVAEGIAGSEENFAAMMTEKAHALGLSNSRFANATGWPDENHRMSVRDLARLGYLLMTQFPEYYHYFKQDSFTYHGIRQPNRNLLLGKNLGVDGLKTGYTEEAGYGLAASANQQGRRLVSVVAGLDSARARASETEKLLRYGFMNFETRTIAQPEWSIATADVWLGETASVPLYPRSPVILTYPITKRDAITVTAEYQDTLTAPVQRGEAVGTLTIERPTGDALQVPIVAGQDVAPLSGIDLFIAKAVIFFGLES